MRIELSTDEPMSRFLSLSYFTMYCWDINLSIYLAKNWQSNGIAEQLKNAICNNIIKLLNLYLCHLLYEFVIIPYQTSLACIFPRIVKRSKVGPGTGYDYLELE